MNQIDADPPPQPTVNKMVRFSIDSFPSQLNLSCTDLLMGNPMPNITWTYGENLPFVFSPTGQQNSVLTFRINFHTTVLSFLYGRPFDAVCPASNRLG